MGQYNEEPVKHFISRLRGQSQVCNFTLPIGQSDYSEKMILHQLICGLSDPAIQEEVLSFAATQAEEVSLDKIKMFVEGKESGKREQGLISKSATLNRMSEYKKSKINNIKTVPLTDETDGKCGWCG